MSENKNTSIQSSLESDIIDDELNVSLVETGLIITNELSESREDDVQCYVLGYN